MSAAQCLADIWPQESMVILAKVDAVGKAMKYPQKWLERIIASTHRAKTEISHRLLHRKGVLTCGTMESLRKEGVVRVLESICQSG